MPDEQEPEATPHGKRRRVVAPEDESIQNDDSTQDDDQREDDDAPVKPTGGIQP